MKSTNSGLPPSWQCEWAQDEAEPAALCQEASESKCVNTCNSKLSTFNKLFGYRKILIEPLVELSGWSFAQLGWPKKLT